MSHFFSSSDVPEAGTSTTASPTTDAHGGDGSQAANGTNSSALELDLPKDVLFAFNSIDYANIFTDIRCDEEYPGFYPAFGGGKSLDGEPINGQYLVCWITFVALALARNRSLTHEKWLPDGHLKIFTFFFLFEISCLLSEFKKEKPF
jgi:hypothetical protein